MPQQINLCTPILLTNRQYLSANSLAVALGVLLLVGGGFSAYWVWSINIASEGLKKTLIAQAQELKSLQTALQQGQAGAGPAQIALTQEIGLRKAALLQREKMQGELQLGLFRPGMGHSARLQLLSQSIPAQVWVTEVVADDKQLDVRGFTLEPAQLNDWVSRLASSPLMQDQKLATVKVESSSLPTIKVPAAAAIPAQAAASTPQLAASAPAPRPVWAFSLLNVMAIPATTTGAKP